MSRYPSTTGFYETNIEAFLSGDPYELRILTGAKLWQPSGVEANGEKFSASLSMAGALVRVTLRSLESGEVRWKVRFNKE